MEEEEGEKKSTNEEETSEKNSSTHLGAPFRSHKRPWEGSRRDCRRRLRPPGPRLGSLKSRVECRGGGESEKGVCEREKVEHAEEPGVGNQTFFFFPDLGLEIRQNSPGGTCAIVSHESLGVSRGRWGV